MPSLDNSEFTRLNKASCGEVVHLQLITATKPIRLKTRLIGVDPNMSVILAYLNDPAWEKALPYLKESNAVIMRYMHNDRQQASVIAFRTSIQKIMTTSGRWLVLDYPKSIESANLRQHKRMAVHIDASLSNSDTKKLIFKGALNDISIQGCAFVSEAEAELTIGNIYSLDIMANDEVKQITLSVGLKNIQKLTDNGGFQYGLIFMTPEIEAKESIQYLLLHHLQQEE